MNESNEHENVFFIYKIHMYIAPVLLLVDPTIPLENYVEPVNIWAANQ